MTSYRRKGVGLFYIVGLLLLASCIRTERLVNIKNRTVLVYIGADNNLSSIANSNIYSMNSCISSGMENYNLLVFVDRKDVSPVLLHLHDLKIDTVARYPEKDSSDPMVLNEVINEMVTNWEAENYGLVLWSHGTGWIPTKQLHFVAPNMNYVQSRDGQSAQETYYEGRRDPFEGTRAFAWEDRKGQTPPYKCMELDEMVEAIPDDLFDYIVFDACYMGNVEIAYALRNKADYIVSSCYEIVSYGFPYHIVTRDFLKGNLLNSCNEFFNYYNDNMDDWRKMAGISLVKTNEMDSLARCFRKIVDEYRDDIPDMDVSNVQCFDRFNNHVFYDLEDFVDKLGTRKEYLTEFRLQLERCVSFKKSTQYIFPGDREAIKVNTYCGLSVYIPLEKFDSSGLNDDYRKTEWSMNTDY